MLGFRPWGWKAMLEAAGREWPGTWAIEPYDLPENLEVYGPVRRFDGDTVLPPIKALAIGRTQQTVGSVIWPKIQKLLGPYIKKTYGMRDGVPTSFLIGESLCELRSYEQEWRKFEGNDWDFAWFDEAPPESIWFSVRRGLTDRGGSGIFTMTPDIEQGWLYDLFEMAPPADTETVAMSIWDNAKTNGGYIEDKEIQAWVSAIPAHERVYRVDGEWPHLVGRIYKSWDRDKHIVEPPKVKDRWPWFCAIDPHDRVPWAILWATLTERHELVVMHEWPDSFWHHETKAMLRPTAEYAEMILDMESRMDIRGQITRIVDPRYARTPAVVTGTCIEDDLHDAGVMVTGDVGKDFDRSNSVAEGHHKVAQWLEADKILVSRDCGFGNVIYAFDHYSWDESTEKHQARHGPKELPGRKYKHYMDCIRMLVEYLHGWDLDLFFRKPQETGQRAPVGVTGYGI